MQHNLILQKQVRENFSIAQNIVNWAVFIRLMGSLISFRPDSCGIILLADIGSNCSGTHTAGKCFYIVNSLNGFSKCFDDGSVRRSWFCLLYTSDAADE